MLVTLGNPIKYRMKSVFLQPKTMVAPKKRFDMFAPWLMGGCVCMRITYSSRQSTTSMNQPGKAANPARGQLNRENGYFSLPTFSSRLRIWSREMGSAIPSRAVSLFILH